MLPYTTKVFTLALCASVSVCRSHILLLSIYRIWAPQKLSIVEHGLVPVDNVEPLLLWMPDWQFAERVARPNRDWPLGAVVEECIPGRCVEWVSSVSADECCFRNRTGTNDIVPATLNHESTRATWISLMDEEALDAGVSTLDLRFPGGGVVHHQPSIIVLVFFLGLPCAKDRPSVFHAVVELQTRISYFEL
jgi:hypothetical protein